jgi:hypothetical protein
VDAQPVLDERAHAHRDRARGDDAEAQQRRRDRLEVGRVGEEGEDRLRPSGQHLLAPQLVCAHHPGYA